MNFFECAENYPNIPSYSLLTVTPIIQAKNFIFWIPNELIKEKILNVAALPRNAENRMLFNAVLFFIINAKKINLDLMERKN